MARQYKYVVKRIENLVEKGQPKRVTWDVYKQDRDSFEFFAECERRSDAVLIAKAVNLFKNRAATKCL